MPSGSDHVVTRFAPSPTGHLHIGGARTALFCWAFARKEGGRFMIRIEDTDQARSSDESARGILEDLAWLGITWDDGPTLGSVGASSRPVGPYFQAQRLDLYNAYVEALVRAGRAYPAFETNEQLEAWRKEAAGKKATFKYPRPADVHFGVFNEQRWARAKAGEAHVVRFVMPDGGIAVQDQVLGEVKFAAGEVDDFVIRKADLFPTYHFAVVVDDELMGVTHVLRAQEHLINTPKHVAMQAAMVRLDDGRKFRTPVYAHMPLIFNTDGTKMSKRDKAKAARKTVKDALSRDRALTVGAVAAACGLDEGVLSGFIAGDNDLLDVAEALAKGLRIPLPEIEVWDFRANGYLPEAITNFLSLLGWSPGVKTADGKDLEKFDMDWLAAHFSIERIGKTNARFDRVKLLSFNGDAVAALSDAAFEARVRAWAGEWEPAFAERLEHTAPDRRAALMRMAKPRCKTLRDVLKIIDFALAGDEELAFDTAAVEKSLVGGGGAGRAVLAEFRDFLAAQAAPEPAAIDAWVKAYAESKGLKMGEVAQPVRIGLTGGTVSPPLGEVVAALGKGSALRRVERCLAASAG